MYVQIDMLKHNNEMSQALRKSHISEKVVPGL